jgi:hypothetical protein
MKHIVTITNSIADLSNLCIENEFVVEVMNHSKFFAVAGKVICNRSLLGDEDLETIWDLANWGVSQPKECVIKGGVYNGDKAFYRDDFLYIPLRKDIDVVNDNMMVRKHYDTNKGYYCKTDRKNHTEEWCFASRDTIIADMKANPFI